MQIKGPYQKRDWLYWWPPQKDGVRPKAIALRTRNENEAVTKVFALQQELQVQHSISKGRMEQEIQTYLAAKKASGEHPGKTHATTGIVLNGISRYWKTPFSPGSTKRMSCTGASGSPDSLELASVFSGFLSI